ncbi:MAG: HAMP domain-containing sensor histidine kinase [Frankiaceae bacterium]
MKMAQRRGPNPAEPDRGPVGRRRVGVPAGLAARLLAANLLVMAAGGVTLVVVLVTVGPPVFTDHVRAALGVTSPEVTRHLDEAFTSALGIGLTIAASIAAVAAFGLSVLISRRIARPVAALATACRQVAAGAYAVSLPPARLGAEFDELHDAFEAMAGSLERTEGVRRRILADLAHELRTPIATVDAYLEGMADGVLPADETTFAVLRDQTARMRRLAEDVDTVSQAEEHRLDLHRATLDPAELVTRAAAAAAPGCHDKGVRLHVDAAASPPVWGDPERLGQVLSGLLDNALRHTPPGRKVDIASTVASNGGARITVTDTGEGIPADALPQVFERFYRADTARDRAHGGSGIGLTIARAVVRAHGGTITADSAGPGTGATFTITLPAASPANEHPS